MSKNQELNDESEVQYYIIELVNQVCNKAGVNFESLNQTKQVETVDKFYSLFMNYFKSVVEELNDTNLSKQFGMFIKSRGDLRILKKYPNLEQLALTSLQSYSNQIS